jgi:predicted dehydrogenase
MKQLEVGIIGAGTIATNMHIPVLRAIPSVRIVWIADTNEHLAGQVARLNKTEARSADVALRGDAPDLLLMAIPLPPRPHYFEALRDTQTAVFAEKPLATTLAQHDALIGNFGEWQIAVGYQRRYYAQFRLAKRIIETGTFGPLRQIIVSEGGRTTRTGGGGDYQAAPISAGGGIVKNLGCHALDLALWLSNAESADVEDNALEIDDASDVVCRAKLRLHSAAGGDCALDFAVSWLARMDNAITLVFDDVSLVCPVSPSASIEVRSAKGDAIGRLDATDMGATTSAQAFFLEWRDFLDAVQGHVPQPMSARATRPVSQVMDQILLSGERP